MNIPKYRVMSIGADPEVFFTTKVGDPQSAEGIVPGTKKAPHQIPKAVLGLCVQLDNVAAEFNIPPCRTPAEFSLNLGRGLRYLSKLAKKKSLVLSLEPALDFPIEQVLTENAQRLGCDPDYNAWTGERNPRPDPPLRMRTAAGHVHVGFLRQDGQAISDYDKFVMATLMDAYLGVPSIMCTLPSNRRKLYGRAGACRLKDYGVEYRTLESFWIGDKPLRYHVFGAITTAVAQYNNNPREMLDRLAEWGDEIQDSINNHDVEEAAMLCEVFSTAQFPPNDRSFLRKNATI